jgi:hypothetical protein
MRALLLPTGEDFGAVRTVHMLVPHRLGDPFMAHCTLKLQDGIIRELEGGLGIIDTADS